MLAAWDGTYQDGKDGDYYDYEYDKNTKPGTKGNQRNDKSDDMYGYGISGGVADAVLKNMPAKQINVPPNDADANFQQGVNYDQVGKIDQAIKYYRQAVRINPDYSKANTNLGIAYMKTGQYTAAIEALKKAVASDDASVLAHYNLGVAYVKRQNVTGAMKQYRKLEMLDVDAAKHLLSMIPSRNQSVHGRQQGEAQ